MAKYEIMLVVSGSLEEAVAKSTADEIAQSISDCQPKVEPYGAKPLAYKIKNDMVGYYFQYNFDCESPAKINEFRRLCLINKNVIRHLIINLEKDYNYRATLNPKKVESNKKTIDINSKRKAEMEKARQYREQNGEGYERSGGEYRNNYNRGPKPEGYKGSGDFKSGDRKPMTRRPIVKKSEDK